MHKTFLSFPLIAAAFGIAATAALADTPTLTVYTYNSFTADWGPGPKITPIFQQQCGCKIQWVGVEDGAALLSRLKLEGKNSRADVVLGLDTSLTAETEATGLIAPSGVDLKALKLPIAWSDPYFVPFDYGYFALEYNSDLLKTPPKSLADLAALPGDEPKILLEDPRTSTPGLGLMLWVKAVYGDKAGDFWKSLAPKILTVSKSWDEAYGLFTKGEAPVVLSYTTSPAYHIMEENTQKYKAMDLAEGNYMEVEVAGMLAGSQHQDLARKFLQFLMTQDFQKQIPTTNWMFPVTDIGSDLPPVFGQIPAPKQSLLLPPDEVAAHRAAWVKEWLDAVGQ
jgi:thiamine transport system substrate-binding protein